MSRRILQAWTNRLHVRNEGVLVDSHRPVNVDVKEVLKVLTYVYGILGWRTHISVGAAITTNPLTRGALIVHT